jgi:Thioredoxin-like domain
MAFPTTSCRNTVCLFGKIVRASSEYSFRETVALEKPDAFFTFLDRLTDAEALMLPADMTPKAIHQAALQIALDDGILEETGSLSAVKMNLALHSATPKLEAFYNHYEDHHNNSRGTQCGSWVDWYGEVVCDANRLAQLAEVETKISSDLKSYVFFFCQLASFCYGSQAGIQFKYTNKTQNPDF